MVTRLIGLLLGLALAAYGYGTIAPQGFVAPYLPAIDLGPFAAYALMVARIALGLGVVLAIAAFIPRGGKPKAKRATFFSEPEAPAEEPVRHAPVMISGSAQPSPLW
jgi:hypothetical protein